MTLLYTIAGGLVAFVLLLRLYLNGRFGDSRLPLPPGPKRLPLIGNLLDMPKTLEWKTYHKWAKELKSDVIYVNIAGTSLIVLDTLEAANDLLDKRSSNYSSRPKMPMLIDLIGYDFQVAIMEYGERWRQHRRLIHQILSPAVSHRILPLTIKAARNLLNRFLVAPDDIMGNLRHMTGELIISVAYGLDVQTKNDPYIALSERGNEGPFEAVVPGAFLVDILPFLKYVPAWVPSAGFQRKALKWKQFGHEMVEIPFEVTKANIRAGACQPCMASMCFEEMDQGTDDVAYTEENIKNATGTLYSDVVSCWLLCSGVIDHPEVVKRAQLELDRVIQPGHLPDFDDQPSLPYITAIVKEALRWNDTTPVGAPHLITTEDEYKGYRLPAGTIVMANCWAILHDEGIYPDLFTFNPDRFMKGDQLDPDAPDPSDACWGFGRRICPGRYMAFSTIWIAIASLLTVYDVKKKVDADGNIIEPSHEYSSTIIYGPKPYVGSITPRSKEAEDLIRSTTSQDA